jgi:hypothetical protein
MTLQVLRMQQDIVHLKGMVDRHTNDLQILNNELKSRPAGDGVNTHTHKQIEIIIQIQKVSEQALDSRMRELHGQMMGVRQLLDKEVQERRQGDGDQGQA